ncbi:MAG: hypothetical protein AB7O21_19600 [Gammaproteobacteria bacterium]
MDLYDAQGRPINTRPEPQREIVQGLPHWLQGLAYRADDDIITIRVRVPSSQLAQEHLLALEATPQGARELIEALQRLVTRSEQTMQVLDVAPSPSR